MVVVVGVLMVRVGEGETDERITNENKYDVFYLQKIGMFEDKFADQKVQCSLAHLYLLARQKILQFLHMHLQSSRLTSSAVAFCHIIIMIIGRVKLTVSKPLLKEVDASIMSWFASYRGPPDSDTFAIHL